MDNSFRRCLTERKHHLSICAERLEGLSPLKKIQSGYAYVTDDKGKNIRSIKQTKAGGQLNIRVTDGMIKAETINTETMKEVGLDS